MTPFCFPSVRCVVFATRQEVERLHPAVWRHVLLDLPGLLFFSTYSLLVLFWAEIFHAARSLPTSGLRPAFVAVNAGVYSVQACVWLYLGAEGDERLVPRASSLFIALVNIGAASGFLLYGGRLFYMLRAFPIESKGRRKKLREVGLVTLVCTACFTARASLVAYAAFHTRFATRLDVLSHPILKCGTPHCYNLFSKPHPFFSRQLRVLRRGGGPPRRPGAVHSAQAAAQAGGCVHTRGERAPAAAGRARRRAAVGHLRVAAPHRPRRGVMGATQRRASKSFLVVQ